MNFDDILGKLMPLFEQKMAFSMEMSKRAMSLEEKKEANKTDLEYRKLEAQITNDKDKLAWEKEKLTTAIKGDYDLQVLKNSGMMDQKRLEGLDAKGRQEIANAGAEKVARINAGVEEKKAYLTTLGTILGHAQDVSQTGVDGVTKTSKPTSEVTSAARSLMEQTGLSTAAARPQARNVMGEAEAAAGILKNHEKAGTKDAARSYLNALDPAVKAETLKLLNPGAAATPTALSPAAPMVTPAAVTPAIPPVTPAPAEKTLIPTVQSTVQPVTTASRVRPYVAPTYEGSYGTPAAPAAPAPAAAVAQPFQDSYGAGIRQRLQATQKTKEEEEKNRALRRARGLTVGGSF